MCCKQLFCYLFVIHLFWLLVCVRIFLPDSLHAGAFVMCGKYNLRTMTMQTDDADGFIYIGAAVFHISELNVSMFVYQRHTATTSTSATICQRTLLPLLTTPSPLTTA